MFRVQTGSEFQAAGPATANELSAKRVLVRRTTKLPRAEYRRRLSLAATAIISVRKIGVKSKKTSNLRTHSLYIMRLATGSKCNRRSSGVAWIRADQTRSTILDSLEPLANRHAKISQQSIAVIQTWRDKCVYQ